MGILRKFGIIERFTAGAKAKIFAIAIALGLLGTPAMADELGEARRFIANGVFDTAFQILVNYDNPARADEFEDVANFYVTRKGKQLTGMEGRLLIKRMNYLDRQK